MQILFLLLAPVLMMAALWIVYSRFAGNNSAPPTGVKGRKKRRLNAESIEILSCAARESASPIRTVYVSCDAIVNGKSYEFDFVHQDGSIDSTGRQERPCWSWISVHGPHRYKASARAEAQFASEPPHRSLGSESLLGVRAVRQAILVWRQRPETKTAAALSRREAGRFTELLVQAGRARGKSEGTLLRP